MSNFHIENRLKNAKDPIRTFNWEVVIPQISTVAPSVRNVEDLIIRARSISLPSRGNEMIVSNFRGMKQFFSGQPTFGNTIAITFEETEDMIITRAMYEWNNAAFDVRPNSPTGGASQLSKKRNLAKEIIIKLYENDTDPTDFQVTLINAQPANVDEVPLDYATNDTIKINVTFQYDFWTLDRSST